MAPVATSPGALQRTSGSPPVSPFATVQTAGSSTYDGFSPHQQSSDAASMTQQEQTAKVDVLQHPLILKLLS